MSVLLRAMNLPIGFVLSVECLAVAYSRGALSVHDWSYPETAPRSSARYVELLSLSCRVIYF